MIPDLAGGPGSQWLPAHRQRGQRLTPRTFDINAGIGCQPTLPEQSRAGRQLPGAIGGVEEHDVEGACRTGRQETHIEDRQTVAR